MTDRRASIPLSQTSEEPSTAPLFGDVLRRFRRAAGLTQEALAEQATLSPRAISDLERGERRWPQRETVHLLAEALHLAPRDRAILEAAARGRDNAASARHSTPTPHNLPASMTPIVGRAREIAAVTTLVRDTDVRLATIVGPGGVGKTRLALAVAAAALSDFPDGVFFVSLAPIRDPDDLIMTIAQTLDVGERGGQSVWASLLTRLRARRVLLILDNFEHLLSEAVVVANLLTHCEQLTMLVTSRAALHLRGEHEYVVPPLTAPDPAAADVVTLAANPAVTLFCQRARAARQDFDLTAENSAAVTSLCVRLDGLPLAIELAAARIKYFTPAMLLTRLDTRLPDLADGPRDAPERQRTMRGTIAWSERLLDDEERALFRQLAVFADGWTLDAAKAVCMHGTRLVSLVDKTLVRVESGEGDQPRFAMLETIREYGWERLVAWGEAAETRQRHAAYFLALVQEAEPELRGRQQATWLARLEREHGNLRAALRWTRESDKTEQGLRLAATLWRFWQGRGRLREAASWLEAFLARDDDTGHRAPPTVRAKALNAAGAAAYRVGDQAHATMRFEESLTIRRTLQDGRGMANTLNNLAAVAHERGDFARARAHYAESLALWRQLGDAHGIAMVLENLGATLSEQGDFAQATAMQEETLRIKEASGDTWGIALTTSNLANFAIAQGEFAHAKALAERSLALYETLSDRWGIAVSLGELGAIALGQGDCQRAATLQEKSLAIRRELGDERGAAIALRHLAHIAQAKDDNVRARVLLIESLTLLWRNANTDYVHRCLEDFGQIACAQGEMARATRFLGAANHFRTTHGSVLAPANQLAHARAMAAIHAALDSEAFTAAWKTGATLPLEEIVAEAIGITAVVLQA